MSLESYTEIIYYLTCNECGKESDFYDSESCFVYDNAERKGWTIDEDNDYNLCPECKS